MPAKKTVWIQKNIGYNEYRVPGKKKTEASAYYTEDKQDAILAAFAMHGRNIEIRFKSVR